MPTPHLPSAELDILMCLIGHGELSVRQIRKKLESRRPLSHSSVSTLLERLSEKGLVLRKKGERGKTFLYAAKSAAKRTPGRLVKDFIDRVFAGRGIDLVATLLNSVPPSAKEIEQLQELLDRLKSERDSNSFKAKRRLRP